MTHIRGKERYSLLPDTTEGILIVKLNGPKIIYFNPQPYSKLFLRETHLRCDDISVMGQPRKPKKKAISVDVLNDAIQACSAGDETLSVLGDEFRFRSNN